MRAGTTKALISAVVLGWLGLAAFDWWRWPYRRIGFPPPGRVELVHNADQLRAIGLIEGMSRDSARERLRVLGLPSCFEPADRRLITCRWDYRQPFDPRPIAWVLEIAFDGEVVSRISSLTAFGFEDR